MKQLAEGVNVLLPKDDSCTMRRQRPIGLLPKSACIGSTNACEFMASSEATSRTTDTRPFGSGTAQRLSRAGRVGDLLSVR